MPDPDSAQRAILGALLEAHPRMLELDELAAQLADVPRVREALRVLVDDGLATRLGDRVGVSRAAVRFDALGPV
jgi:DNA-binding GntR family transcriptional regulator